MCAPITLCKDLKVWHAGGNKANVFLKSKKNV